MAKVLGQVDYMYVIIPLYRTYIMLCQIPLRYLITGQRP